MINRGILFSAGLLLITMSVNAQKIPELYLASGFEAGLPLIEANNNKSPAGTISDGEIFLDLEIVESDFRPETNDRPGVKVWAFREKGKAPTVPAPLLRSEVGTIINVSFTNNHPDSIVHVYGLNDKGEEDSEEGMSFEPGESKSWSFIANTVGTYFYFADIGIRGGRRFGETEQLAGAFIIDEVDADINDEVIVINIFSQSYDSTYMYPFIEALTMNGKSWPFSELFKPEVGDSLTWRIINASRRNHPMHLHGFYYDIESLGNSFEDNIYAPEDVRTVVTESMRGRTTMKMTWVPSREGKWMFHCHLSFHVSSDVRLPGAEEHDTQHVHMAGLVMGVDVQPGSSDLISRGEIRKMTMYASEYTESEDYKYSFSLESDFAPDSVQGSTPGPLLIMKQYETTDVEVINQMNEPTGVHWHGLELDSWADGVPNFSASAGKVSPIIEPGESFVYRLSHMRAGTFIYHSHLNDIEQITGGLYGPLIVMPEDEEYDPYDDHTYILQWRSPNPNGPTDVEVNGITMDQQQNVVNAKVGEEHRLRMINIAPAGGIRMFVKQDTTFVPILAWAKDGADLPESQRVYVDRSMRIGVGETIDFIFKPEDPGTYQLFVGYNENDSAKQTWIVKD